MKCPICNYKHGYELSENGGYDMVEGEEGDFYSISNSIEMNREHQGYGDNKTIVGCPKCNILFME